MASYRLWETTAPYGSVVENPALDGAVEHQQQGIPTGDDLAVFWMDIMVVDLQVVAPQKKVGT